MNINYIIEDIKHLRHFLLKNGNYQFHPQQLQFLEDACYALFKSKYYQDDYYPSHDISMMGDPYKNQLPPPKMMAIPKQEYDSLTTAASKYKLVCGEASSLKEKMKEQGEKIAALEAEVSMLKVELETPVIPFLHSENYTVGPWKVRPNMFEAGLNGHYCIDAPDHPSIAEVLVKMEEDHDTRPDLVANAYLVAAAPQLARALEFCVDIMTRNLVTRDERELALKAAEFALKQKEIPKC